MLWILSAWAAAPTSYRIPFPVSPIFEGEQSVCMDVDIDFGVPNVAVEEGPFLASCAAIEGHTRLCVTLLEGATWPDDFAELACEGADGGVRMLPIHAFDPSDSIDDGVEIVRTTSQIKAMFRVGFPLAVGVLPGGSCFVDDGLLTMIVGDTESRKQRCVLVEPDGSERVVPITLVNRLRSAR